MIKPSPNKIFQRHNPKGIKLVTRLRLDLFKSISLTTASKMLWIIFVAVTLDIETASHYFLHCLLFYAERSTLLKNINEIDSTILIKSESVITRILLYGDESFKDEVNLLILNAMINFVLSTNRIDEPLHLLWIHGRFSFYSWLYYYNFTIFNILIFTFSYYFFFMVSGRNIHFHRKKKRFKLDFTSQLLR